jgi:hypothetical protein
MMPFSHDRIITNPGGGYTGQMDEYRFKAFGRLVAIGGQPGAWRATYLGADGKRRPADFIVPGHLQPDELAEYLADLFHEEATPSRPNVVRLP